MFQNSLIEKYLGCDKKAYSYQVLITDSDFSESIAASIQTSEGETLALEIAASGAAAVIEVYGKRNLNVPLNLYLLCKKIQEKYDWISIKEQIEFYQKCIKDFNKYSEQVLQYHQRYNNQKVFW